MFSVRLPCEELWDILLDEIDDTERGGVGTFGDRNVDGALAIDERVAEFDIGGVGDSPYIAYEDGAGSVGADGNVAQTLYIRHHRVQCVPPQGNCRRYRETCKD